jgi:hypothetical protein
MIRLFCLGVIHPLAVTHVKGGVVLYNDLHRIKFQQVIICILINT